MRCRGWNLGDPPKFVLGKIGVGIMEQVYVIKVPQVRSDVSHTIIDTGEKANAS